MSLDDSFYRLGWLSVAADMAAGLDSTAARTAARAAGVDHLLLAAMDRISTRHH